MRAAALALGLAVAPCGAQPRWSVAASAGTLDLLAVDLVDGATGWAAGDMDPRGTGGALYRTSDAGRRWRMAARKTETITAVRFLTSRTGWAAGLAGRVERTDDGGTTWVVQRSEREGEVLNSLFAIDERTLWIVGGRGTALRTTDGGTTWVPSQVGVREDLWAVHFASPERGWIVGDGGVLLGTTDAGEHWTALLSGTKKSLYAVATAGPNLAVAVGESGTILRTEDGIRWAAVDGRTTSTLNSVSGVAPGIFWAAGAWGVLSGSRDGGRSWSLAPSPTSRKLMAVVLAGSGCGIAVGQGGTVLTLESRDPAPTARIGP